MSKKQLKKLKKQLKKANKQLAKRDKAQQVVHSAIQCIAPYWLNTTQCWVFDDERHGLTAEAFVSGASELIDEMVSEHVADTDKPEMGFRMTFSASPFPGYNRQFNKMDKPGGSGTWYQESNNKGEGWLCPALFHYFDEAPAALYTMAEALPAPIVYHTDNKPATVYMPKPLEPKKPMATTLAQHQHSYSFKKQLDDVLEDHYGSLGQLEEPMLAKANDFQDDEELSAQHVTRWADLDPSRLEEESKWEAKDEDYEDVVADDPDTEVITDQEWATITEQAQELDLDHTPLTEEAQRDLREDIAEKDQAWLNHQEMMDYQEKLDALYGPTRPTTEELTQIEAEIDREMAELGSEFDDPYLAYEATRDAPPVEEFPYSQPVQGFWV